MEEYVSLCATYLPFYAFLAVAGIGHGTIWLCAMTQEGHSCIVVMFFWSSEEAEAWKQTKQRGSLMMSKMHPYSSISHLLPKDVIWKLAKEIGMPESEFNSGLASGKLCHLATWMINTEQKIRTSLTQDTEGMLMSVVTECACLRNSQAKCMLHGVLKKIMWCHYSQLNSWKNCDVLVGRLLGVCC